MASKVARMLKERHDLSQSGSAAQGSTPLDNRKDFLLALLAADGGDPILGVTRLQKYLFLLDKDFHWPEKFGVDWYHFEAYNYGPFDAQVYDDLDFLENVGLVTRESAGEEPSAENDELRQSAKESGTTDFEFQPWEEDTDIQRYKLTEQGENFVKKLELDDADKAALDKLKHQWNREPLNMFLRWLYKAHPDYAKNTKLKHLQG